MNALSVSEAREFAERWLPAWTGNNPELLVSFYSDDAFYLDPAIPQGIHGKPALLSYFRTLLAHNPNWVWRQIEGIPMEGGFVNKWSARIPVGEKVLEVVGVCFVQLGADGKIRRNEVYFDRAQLLAEIESSKKSDA
jgi:steroid delta-isomerase-like uncharacterized protein